MARYCPLFSGSEGNCTYIGNAHAGILIDAGVSAKRIETALAERKIDLRRIAAVFVTHEHADHVRGLRVLTKRYAIPVYASSGTMAALESGGHIDPAAPCHTLMPDDPRGVSVGDCHIVAFSTPHDSRQSCGYRIHTADGRQIAIATDIGVVTEAIRTAITGCDLIQIESNHDPVMLRHGTYPESLKRRILSSTGHLSNEACATELFALAQRGASRFVLAHLSRQNNRPQLAYETARQALASHGLLENMDYLLHVASPCDQQGMRIF